MVEAQNGAQLSRLRSFLAVKAKELSFRYAKSPVLLQHICDDLGIKIQKSSSVPAFKAYLSIDPSKDEPAAILVPPGEVKSFGRFCIAHEIAHFLVCRDFKIIPRSPAACFSRNITLSQSLKVITTFHHPGRSKFVWRPQNDPAYPGSRPPPEFRN